MSLHWTKLKDVPVRIEKHESMVVFTRNEQYDVITGRTNLAWAEDNITEVIASGLTFQAAADMAYKLNKEVSK